MVDQDFTPDVRREREIGRLFPPLVPILVSPPKACVALMICDNVVVSNSGFGTMQKIAAAASENAVLGQIVRAAAGACATGDLTQPTYDSAARQSGLSGERGLAQIPSSRNL